MGGEEMDSSDVTFRGLPGDRAFALIDSSDGKAATAKNPRKWPNLFEFQATYINNAERPGTPRVHIKLPDGTTILSDHENVDQVLSTVLQRDVKLQVPPAYSVNSEQYWPAMDGFKYRDAVTDFTLPEGTFFDGAMLHIITMAALNQLHQHYPEGRFDVRRFRPNIVVQTSTDRRGFVEDDWVGRTIAIGSEVQLNITRKTGRCVMVTLPQGDLPKDPGILRTAAKQNAVNVGVYAAVKHGGVIRRGDSIRLL